MESSWRDDHFGNPASSSSTSTSTLHRRGISDEASLLWTTSQTNGELGLGPGLVIDPVATATLTTSDRLVLDDTCDDEKRSIRRRIGPGPLPIAVWARVMDSSKGRDKVLKCLQYTLRTYLYVLSLVAAIRPLSPWFKANSKRMRLATSSLSLTRKCLLLLNPLHPLTHLLSPTPTSASTLIRHLIDLASALADDTFCLSRLGIVSRRTGRQADKWANRFWFLTTILGLYKVYTQSQTQIRLRRLESEDEAAAEAEKRTTAYKLWSDLIFVSYDVFDFTWFKEPVQCGAGLISACISTGKLYDQHWAASASLGKG